MQCQTTFSNKTTERSKRRVNAKQEFRVPGRAAAVQGYEAINIIRKGQVRWVSGTDILRRIRFIKKLFDLAI